MKITCPECSERFDISTDMIGKKAKCGECAHVFVVHDVAEKKVKKDKVRASVEETSDVRQTAWLSLYLAGMSLGLLFFGGQQMGMMSLGKGMIVQVLLRLAIDTAAIYLLCRGFWSVWAIRESETDAHLVKTAIIVDGILLGLLIVSVLLMLFALVSGGGTSGNDLGGLGSGLGDIMKNMNEINKLVK